MRPPQTRTARRSTAGRTERARPPTARTTPARRAGGSRTVRRRRGSDGSESCPLHPGPAGRVRPRATRRAPPRASLRTGAARSRSADRPRWGSHGAAARRRPDHPKKRRCRSIHTSCDLPVELFVWIELLEAVLERAEVDRLLVTEAEHAEVGEALVEQSMDAVLQRTVEIDHHVAADDRS